MKCVNIHLFYALKWSDAQGATYGRFSGFLSLTFVAREEMEVVSNPLKKKENYLIWPELKKKANFKPVRICSINDLAGLISMY